MENFVQGKVIKSISSFHYVDIGKEVYECKSKGILKFKNKNICVGDIVEIEILDENQKKGSILKVFDRKNFLKRPVISNVTKAILVFAAKNPNPNLSLIDRFLILANREDIDILLIINKTDLDDENIFEKIKDKYKHLDIKIIGISAKYDDDINLIKNEIKNNTTIIAGPSGSGKSTLINKIANFNQKTNDVSEKIGRGKHTTRYVELLKIDEDTYLADSPGFSSIDIDEFDEFDLKDEFMEFVKYEADCKFSSNCLHLNEPDCMVKKAVGEGKISTLRYESYVQLQNEIKDSKRRKY